jgi:hypothetical protein
VAMSHPPTPRALNLWRGLAIEPTAGEWPHIRYHLEQIICVGDPVKWEYLFRLLAWKVQNPCAPTEVVVAMRSDAEGTGKGTLFRVLRQIFGQHARTVIDMRRVLSGFNSQAVWGTAVLLADEAFFAADRGAATHMKSLITEPYLVCEEKFKPRLEVPNSLAIFLATNAEFAVPAGPTARRYFVLDVSPAKVGDTAYWQSLHASLTHEAPHMLHEMLALDLGAWHPRENVPKTVELRQQKRHALEPYQAWIAEQLDGANFWTVLREADRATVADRQNAEPDAKHQQGAQKWEDEPLELEREAVLAAFTEWQRGNGFRERAQVSRERMGKELRRWLGAQDVRRRSGPSTKRPRMWLLPVRSSAEAIFEARLAGNDQSADELAHFCPCGPS